MLLPPPDDLPARTPTIYTAPTGQVWYRTHKVGLDPVYFGTTGSQRWDAPRGEYGVLYLGSNERCAFMESIGRQFLRTRLVLGSELKARELSKIGFTKDLRLVDMVVSGGLTRLGAEGSLVNGLGYENSQLWSAALRAHPAKVDGIYYRSRHDQALVSCALFDHCRQFVRVIEHCGTWASQTALIASILDHYHFATDL